MRGTPLLECEELSKIFCGDFDRRRNYAIRDILFGMPRHDRLRAGERFALQNFSVTVNEGENVAVLGLPDAGKTTIARLLTGVLRPDGGAVRASGRVGLIFSGKLGMNPFLTVGEFAQLAVSIHGAEPDNLDACCDAALELTGLADDRDTGIVDIQDSGLGYLSLAASLVVPQELRIFDGVPRVGDDPVGTRIAACVGRHFEQGGNLILTATAAGLPANLSHALIVHDGETLYEGRPEMALQIYERFAYRMERTQKVDEERRASAAAPAAEDLDEAEDVDENEDEIPSAAALMQHHAVKVDRSLVASLAEDQVAEAWRSDQPLILGPYLSSVTVELLHWRPFIAWMRARFGPRTAPVVAVSRGRVDAWYAGLADRYIDVCDLLPFETYMTHRQEVVRNGGTLKQKGVSDFDQELLDEVATRLGAAETAVLHPSVLFRVSSAIQDGAVPISWLAEHARYDRFDTPPLPPRDTLAQEPYVAASFWYCNCFSDSARHRKVVDDVLQEVSRRVPVVLVNPDGIPGLSDSIAANDRIRVVATGQTDHALRDQAAVIAGARAVVGTFGGMSLLAPSYNVPVSLMFGEEYGSFRLQDAVAREIGAALPDRCFDMTRTTEFDPVRLGAWVDHVLQ